MSQPHCKPFELAKNQLCVENYHMGIFLVTATDKQADVEASVRNNFPDAFYRVPNNTAWFVVFKGTTIELSEKLGLTSGGSGSGVVIPVNNYYGRASKDMWEWLASRMENN